MEGLNMEEMLKDPRFHELVSQYNKPPATESKPPSPPASGASPHVDHKDDEDRGRTRTQGTHISSTYTRDRTLSRSSSMGFETAHKPTIATKNERYKTSQLGPSLKNHCESQKPVPAASHSRRDSIYNKYDASHQSPSRRERSRSPAPKSSHTDWEREVPEHYRRDQEKPLKQYPSSRHSHSYSPRCYKDEYNRLQYHRSRSRSQSPHQGRYNNDRHSYGTNHQRSPRRYESDYNHRQYHHSHSRSPRRDQTPPRRNEIKRLPVEHSGMLPSQPDGWNDPGYYYQARTSYEVGGKDGARANKTRGGRVKIQDKSTGEKVKYSTLLEKMSREDKYLFIKEHGHPFAPVAGLPYFNPYGKVPLDDKLTAIIPKTKGKLFASSGQRLDYSEYVEGRGVMRAAVITNIPNEATIEEGKFLTWAHFGPSARLKVYNYVYTSKPYFYHFRDKSGENNWLLDIQAADYLLEVASYHKKTRSEINPVDYLRRHGSKNQKSQAQKLYIEEPNTENPYYYPVLGIDNKYAGEAPASRASAHLPQPPSSTKVRDARRADKVVAEEEVRARIEASKQKPGKAVSKTSSAKGKTKPEAKRRIESDDEDSDDEGSKLVSRPARSDGPSSAISLNKSKPQSNHKPARGTAPVAGSVMGSKKSLVPSSRVSELEGDEPVKEMAKWNKATLHPNPEEKEPKDKLEKAGLSARERARLKMRPLRELTPVPEEEVAELEYKTKENEPKQGKDDEVEVEFVSEQGQKRATSCAKGDEEEEEEEQHRGKRAKTGPNPMLCDSESKDLSSTGSQPSTVGMRIVKTTRMTVKIPTPGSVATRTRQKTKQ